VYSHEDIVRKPFAGDTLHPPDDNLLQFQDLHFNIEVTKDAKAWWYMCFGCALGMLNGMLIDYDQSILTPLELVVGTDELFSIFV